MERRQFRITAPFHREDGEICKELPVSTRSIIELLLKSTRFANSVAVVIAPCKRWPSALTAPCFFTGSIAAGGCGLPSTGDLPGFVSAGNGKIQGVTLVP
jgi:hypothetical protein